MDDRVVKVAVVAGGGFAAYELLYKPWAVRQELQRLADAAALAAAKKGGTKDAIAGAIGAACAAGAAAYKMPPAIAGPVCQGVGLLAVKGAIAAAKGAKIVGKVIGKGAAVVGKDIGKGVKAAVYTAPKAVGKVAAKGVKSIGHSIGLWGIGDLASFTAPPTRNPFSHHRAGRSPVERKRRSLAGVPGAGPGARLVPNPARRPAIGADFYTRHL